MKSEPRKLELLSPARDADTAIAALKHGADAVYMGASSHGARKSAANSLDDLRRVIDYAHIWRARVYATVNTLIYEHELRDVERLIYDLWRIGTDAIIVQDMGVLRLDIPPIELHASTQCDIRTPEKAQFLERAGFSQIVLARELSLSQISEICRSVSIPVETFVHGALCVSYSGQCRASQAACGRSGNRGECAQLCRHKYTLRDAGGKVLVRDRHLLSLRDFNASEQLPALIEGGVSSFKIEGRLKDAGYVKNITSLYSRQLDRVVAQSAGKYQRASYGRSEIKFEPCAEKSFNRGFTGYFLSGHPEKMASLQTNKSLGERITQASQVHNGDGLSYFNSQGEYEGMRINNASQVDIEKMLRRGALYRTFDVEHEKQMNRSNPQRRLRVDISVDESGATAVDERGVMARVSMDVKKESARNPMDISKVFSKLGDTEFHIGKIENNLGVQTFIPASDLTAVRRCLIEALRLAAQSSYPLRLRRPEDTQACYIKPLLYADDNVANSRAEEFYASHGATTKEYALETVGANRRHKGALRVMTCKYCILRELDMCMQEGRALKQQQLPLRLISGRDEYILKFDCGKCEMSLYTEK